MNNSGTSNSKYDGSNPQPVAVQIKIPNKLAEVFLAKDVRVRGAYGGRGSGKCLGKGTKVIMADGSLAAVESVKAGDKLLSPDGTHRNVLSTVKDCGPLYQITQVSGMDYVCNDAHILVLERSRSAAEDYGTISKAGNRQRPNGRYNPYDTGKGYSLITAEEYSQKPERFKAQHYGMKRAIKGEERELPVDPYLLGVWLGDGREKGQDIANPDNEILSYIAAISLANGWTNAVNEKKCRNIYIGNKYQREDSFRRQLKNCGALGNKHIPEVYYGSSKNQRLALLAGLIDTDGHIGSGYVDISQSREVLLDGIERLANGLGFKTNKRPFNAKLNGKTFPQFRLSIGGDINTIPLIVERKAKAAGNLSKNKDWRRTRIDATPIGDGDYYGFELDGDHLFMLEDGTVTHNTVSFAKMAAIRGYELAQAGKTGIILCGREFMNSLEDSSMAEIKKAIRSMAWLERHYDIGDKYIRTKDKRIEFAFVGMRHNLDSIKSKSSIHLFWADEAESISETAWVKTMPTVREHNSEVWVTWNPERETSAAHKRFRLADDDDMIVVEVNHSDNPWFPDVLERERLSDLRNRSDEYDHIWNGGFKTHVDGAYYAKHIAMAKSSNRVCRVPIDPLLPVKLFCDIGGTGAKSDAFAIWAAQFVGHEVRIVNYYEAQGQDVGYHLNWMRSQGYDSESAEIYLPHDGGTHDRVYSVSYESAFKQAGYRTIVIPNQGKGAAAARIEAGRRLFPSMVFDEDGTKDGLYILGFYHEKRDEKKGGIGLGPNHDDASHCGDAFGLMAVAHKKPRSTATQLNYKISRPRNSAINY